METRLMRLQRSLSGSVWGAQCSIRLVADDPTFPRPVKVGRKVVAWRSDLVEEWIVRQGQ